MKNAEVSLYIATLDYLTSIQSLDSGTEGRVVRKYISTTNIFASLPSAFVIYSICVRSPL